MGSNPTRQLWGGRCVVWRTSTDQSRRYPTGKDANGTPPAGAGGLIVKQRGERGKAGAEGEEHAGLAWLGLALVQNIPQHE